MAGFKDAGNSPPDSCFIFFLTFCHGLIRSRESLFSQLGKNHVKIWRDEDK